jgi:flagellar hook-associated protein FlgK
MERAGATMEDFSDKPVSGINSTYYQDTIAEQNAQIYKLYKRVSDLINERDELRREVERLSQFDKLE